MKMRINALMIAVAMLFSGVVFGQNARETTIKLKKVQQNAMIADYNASPKITEDALKEYLDKAVIGKMRKSQGFYTFSKATWSEVSNETADIYFKVDGRKNKSTITVLYSKGYDNFISSSTDPETSTRIANFLNNFDTILNAHLHTLEVEKQTKVVVNRNDDLKNAISRSEGYKSDISKLQKKLEDNNKEIENLQKQLGTEQSKLDQLKK